MTALFFLDVLETAEARVAAPFVLDAASAWILGGDTRFWNQFGVGRLVCKILDALDIVPRDVIQLSMIADAISFAGVPEGETLRATVQESGV